MSLVISSGFMIMMLGIIYIALVSTLYGLPCENSFWWYGIVSGVIAIIVGMASIVLNFVETGLSERLQFGLSLLVVFAIAVVGIIIQSTQTGAECRSKGSTIWLSMSILHYLIIPILAMAGLYYFEVFDKIKKD